MRIPRSRILVAALLLVAFGASGTEPAGSPPPAKVTTIFTKPLPEYPGKEGLVITVDYLPGGASPLHHHDAHAFVYVLEGSLVMQVEGGEEVTLLPGQAWTESPNDVHTVSRNASQDKPAKFLVVLLKDADKPAVIPGRP